MAKAKTREKILTAAEKLFSRDGFDGVPTKLIAKEAGITEMTLFNHFPKKELLYKTIVKERYLAIEIKSVFSDLSYDDLEQDLMRITHMLLKNFVTNKQILMMRLKEKRSFQDDATFSMEKDPLLNQVSPVFETYAENGLINMDGKRAALLFMTTFKGLSHICILDHRKEADIMDLSNDYVRTFCQGLLNRPER